MKKMMKKIKSNKLIPKLAATLTICMVLLSSLSFSAFAADDEVSAANDESESITDVWTSVMNWITSSLGSAQGVFFGSSSSFAVEVGEVVDLNIFGSTVQLYPVLNLPDLNDGDSLILIDGSSSIPLFVSSTSEIDFPADKFLLTSDGDPFGYFNISSGDLSVPGWSFPFDPAGLFISTGSPSLTFLGTLAVIGVAIAIAFLLISVISRFLRLRG